jgi:hypothetical protein
MLVIASSLVWGLGVLFHCAPCQELCRIIRHLESAQSWPDHLPSGNQKRFEHGSCLSLAGGMQRGRIWARMNKISLKFDDPLYPSECPRIYNMIEWIKEMQIPPNE